VAGETSAAARDADVRLARTLSIVSVVWGALAAVSALALGVAIGSLSTVGFGIDSAIDSAASVVLVWRFHVERQDPVRAIHVEHVAVRILGVVLIVSALALLVGAVRALVVEPGIHPIPAQTVLLIASLVVLPPLAIAKRRVSGRLGSRALANDALLTGAAAVLAAVALVSTAAAGVFGLWWADPLGALAIAAVLGREGWSSLRESSAR
jgi:divalent metal cation (Fe/Co/Zn/Cd) transporter